MQTRRTFFGGLFAALAAWVVPQRLMAKVRPDVIEKTDLPAILMLCGRANGWNEPPKDPETCLELRRPDGHLLIALHGNGEATIGKTVEADAAAKALFRVLATMWSQHFAGGDLVSNARCWLTKEMGMVPYIGHGILSTGGILSSGDSTGEGCTFVSSSQS